jgi:O-acetyl-ADP-ribose deacetylase (regulator of RNase III)
MIEYRKGDILQSGCEAIVNTVNCVGVMGKGLALHCKNHFPAMFRAYREACNNGEVKIGKCHVWENPDGTPRLIINFPTKDDWRQPSTNLYIVLGLADLHEIIKQYNIKSIAVPALGCQNGGLEWVNVRLLLENFHVLLPDDVKMVVYEPLEGWEQLPINLGKSG